jgi:hypothetical protein
LHNIGRKAGNFVVTTTFNALAGEPDTSTVVGLNPATDMGACGFIVVDHMQLVKALG